MICAVIVSYNSEKVFRCYKSVKDQVDFIIIVDNATKDNSIREKLKTLSSDDTHILLNDNNLGIAKAFNQGIEFARNNKCDWIITLDQDSQLPEMTVSNMMKAYDTLSDDIKEKVAVLGCKYKERSFKERSNKKNDNELFKKNNLMISSGNFIKISALAETGLFEEKLFIDYVDIEFYYRVLKAGYLNLEAQNIIIVHEFGKSEKKFGFHITNQSHFRRYYISRNSIYFFKKFLFFKPYRSFRVVFGAIFGGIAKIMLFEKDKIKKFKYILIGIKDGIFNNFDNKYLS